MLKFLVFLIIFCVCFRTAYSQDQNYYGANIGERQQNSQQPYRPFNVQGPQRMTIYGGTRRHRKPCSRRFSSQEPILHNGHAQWLPPFTSQVLKPLAYNNNVNLEPQSLKNGIYEPVENKTTQKENKDYTVPIQPSDDPANKIIPATSKSIGENECDPELESYGHQFDINRQGASYDESLFETDKNELITQVNDNESRDKCTNIKKSSGSLENINDGSRRSLYKNTDQRLPTSPSPVNEKENKDVLHLNNAVPENEVNLAVNTNNVIESRDFQNVQDVDKPDATMNNLVSRTNIPAERPLRYGNFLNPKSVGNLPGEPTKGLGISDMTKSQVVLMENSRICYACSSASDPTCWNPDRRTTVKYCNKNHDACVSKTFKNQDVLVLIRDCSKSCDDTSIPGVVPKYKSCSICHSDFCNSAYSINTHYFMFIPILASLANMFKNFI